MLFRSGLSRATWPARYEIIHRDPLVIYDGAHNPQGVDAAVKSTARYFPDRRVFALSGVLRDKDYDYIASRIASVACKIYTITPDNPRALSAEEYAEAFVRHGSTAIPCDGVKEALFKAIEDAARDGAHLICLGSLYTYVELYGALKEYKNLKKEI